MGDGYIDHDYWGRPEDMTMSRPAWAITESAPGSELAGETAAAMAAASILFRSQNPGINHSLFIKTTVFPAHPMDVVYQFRRKDERYINRNLFISC